jgi:hypothetical protein
VKNIIHFALCVVALGSLAGCSADQIELENKYQPYAGSDRYPIHVARGKARAT